MSIPCKNTSTPQASIHKVPDSEATHGDSEEGPIEGDGPCLRGYLDAYSSALRSKPTKERPFTKVYVDAFAETGYRLMKEISGNPAEELLFPDLAEPAPQALLDGSARIALRASSSFDRYVFIEQSIDRCVQLERLSTEFPELASRICVRQADANLAIREIFTATDWRSYRAVMFLDPYGMQVEWETIDTIARTKAIDMWLLFPLGIGVNRLLTRSGKIPESWRHRLNLLLGTEDWYDELYRVEHQPDLFGSNAERVVKATTDTIGRYFDNRLRGSSPGVADPGVLRNSSNCPPYLLCFAAASENGAPIALRIANHLLKDLR